MSILSRYIVGCLLGLFFCLPALSTAQTIGDSTKTHQKKTRLLFDFTFDMRSSFIQNNPIAIYGLNTGFWLNDKIRVGIGGYVLAKQPILSKILAIPPANKIYETLKLSYATAHFKWRFYNKKRIEFSVPVAIGLGKYAIHFTETDAQGQVFKGINRGTFIPVEVGIGSIFKPIRWAGIKSSIGYRFSFLETDVKQSFDGMYYNVGVAVFLGNIYRDLSKKRTP